jgi:predicted transcriptional regulator
VFEEEYQDFWKEQVRGASGQRLEMLQRDLTGTKKLLEMLLKPVLGTFKGLILEHEMVSLSGTKIYGDTFHPQLRTVFEEDSFVTHAEKITRDRFSFERARARSIATLGYIYFPYSRDELEKKPDFCQRNLYELIGRIGNVDGTGLQRLPVYEREVMRFAVLRNKSFRLVEVCEWLQLKRETCRKIIRNLESSGLVYPIGGGRTRCHEFMITEKGISLLHRHK